MPCQDALHLPQLFEKDLRFPKGRPGCAHASVFRAACEFRVRACSRLLSAGGVAGLQDRREVGTAWKPTLLPSDVLVRRASDHLTVCSFQSWALQGCGLKCRNISSKGKEFGKHAGPSVLRISRAPEVTEPQTSASISPRHTRRETGRSHHSYCRHYKAQRRKPHSHPSIPRLRRSPRKSRATAPRQ